jgi:4-oxalomesaconate tautomerase
MLAPPLNGGTIASPYFSPARWHAAHALTGVVCVGAACNIRGSIAAQIANPQSADLDRIVIEHPSGRMEALCSVDRRTNGGLPVIARASVVTTTRPLFAGNALVRKSAFVDAK